jgi:hypothetical protein
MALKSQSHTPISSAAGTGSTTVASSGSVGLTNNTVANVTSKVLQPGVYLAWGTVDYQLTSSTVASFECGISNSASTFLTQAGNANFGPDPNALLQVANGTLGTNLQTLQVGPVIVTVTTALTVYLDALATFSAGSISAYGSLYTLQISLP